MAEVKWIKIVTDIFDDEKILLIETLPEADSIIVIWFKLLCLAGKQNNSGVFVMGDKIPYTDKMLATIFRRNENIVKLALNTFEQFGMIEIIDNVITIPNWEKHQMLDQLELAREQTRKRVAKHREKQKKLVNRDNCNVTVALPVTQCNGDRIDKIREDKNRIDENISKDKEVYIPASEEKSSSAFVKANEIEKTNSLKDEELQSKEETKTVKASKHKYGEYQNVLLKDEELQKLKKEYQNWEELIRYLDEYIEMKGYKAKSHYLCIKKWVVDAVKKKWEGVSANGKNTDYTRKYQTIDFSKNRTKCAGEEIDDTGLI